MWNFMPSEAERLAEQGLVAGETIAGVAGGVNAQMLPITTCTICGLSALSREARCKTFDASADGYGRGEAFAGVASLGERENCEVSGLWEAQADVSAR